MKQDESPTVALVSSTWRASVFEIRGVDSDGEESVRWVTVPRRDVERFAAAFAAGLLGAALREVLDVDGRYVPGSLDDEFGVFDVRPDDALLLSPERGEKSSRRSDRSKAGRSHRPRSRQLAVVAGGGVAVVTLGLVAMQAFGDEGSPSVAPVTAASSTTVVPTTTATTSTTSTTTTTTTTTAPLVGPFVVATPEILPTDAYTFDGSRQPRRSGAPSPLVLVVDCTEEPCTVTVDEGLPNPVTMPIVEGAIVEPAIGAPVNNEGCPAEWLVVITPNLVFEFVEGRVAPIRVTGTLAADIDVFELPRLTCLGAHEEWEIDAELSEP